MTERNRERSERSRIYGESPSAGDGNGLGEARTRADRLLRAADDAIARALSNDSERFLEATRQSGGQ